MLPSAACTAIIFALLTEKLTQWSLLPQIMILDAFLSLGWKNECDR